MGRECLAAVLQREAEGMLDLAAGDFVVAGKSGKDGQAGSVGGSPGVGTLFVIEKIPDRG
jgi:hypothetical protein